MELMDHLFSSPEKPKNKVPKALDSHGKNPNNTISSEESMDIGDSTSGRKMVITSSMWLLTSYRHHSRT
jgi:hypothetical protein